MAPGNANVRLAAVEYYHQKYFLFLNFSQILLLKTIHFFLIILMIEECCQNQIDMTFSENLISE